MNNALTHLSIEVLLALCGKCLGSKNSKLRHRIHQWSVIKFVEMLKHNQLKFLRFQMLILPPLIPLKGEKLKKVKQIVEKVVRVLNPYLMTRTAHEGGGY